jgi:hypothetical protein
MSGVLTAAPDAAASGRGLDGLAVQLVGALGGDHRHQLLDHVDVAAFDHALLQRAQAVGARRGGLRRARGRRFGKQVLPARVQARRVHEAGELDLAHVLRRGLVGHHHADDAVAPDADLLRVGRDVDARLQHVTGRRDQLPGVVDLERTVAGVGRAAVGHGDLEEALAVDGQVEVAAALLQRALREVARGGGHARTQAHLQARGQQVLAGAGGSGLAQVLVHQVLEHHAAALEPVGSDVGEVVRNGVQLGLLAFHAGLGDPQ